MPATLPAPGDAALEAKALAWRRRLVAWLNLISMGIMAGWCAAVLNVGGWSAVDLGMFIAFLFVLPWTMLGFWNALIGLILLHGARHPRAPRAPDPATAAAPLALRTAIFMTLRNEAPERALLRLRLIKADLDASGQGGHFGYFLLSDSDNDEIAAAELAGFSAWKAQAGGDAALFYRRRSDNHGFKAGNIADFLARWGDEYDLMLPLDADSLMDAATILNGVHALQAQPKLGILQTLVVGMPSASAFARIFQFGMRQGMRAYTNGQVWWTGDCGQFWGHNAFVRIAPFRAACALPEIPGGPPFGGPILSHDQIEAAFMRRAGFEVRILPHETGSWEENPPTLLEFMRRNTRWCQGNLQYCRLLTTPGLLPLSRFQLIWAILMFVSVPGWTALPLLAALKPFDGEDWAAFPARSALALYLVFLAFNQMPKLAGLIDVLLTPQGASRYGGWPRFLAAGLIEMIHSWLLGAVDSFRITLFMLGLAIKLAPGKLAPGKLGPGKKRAVIWAGQARDAHGVPWRLAAATLWPQTLFGVVVLGLMANHSLALALLSLPVTLGYVSAIPFCVLGADPDLGAFLKRHKLFAVPEEFEMPPILRQAQAEGGACPPAA